MNVLKNGRLLLAAAGGITLSMLYTSIGFGQTAQDFNPANFKKPEVATPVVASSPNPGPMISDGSPVALENFGVSIKPPQGWEVVRDIPGVSLMFQEPKKDGPVQYEKPIFQRNITMAVTHVPSSIDENEAKAVKEKLTQEFSKNPSIKDFRVLDDHRFFNYRGTNDGLVVYSAFTMMDIPMMQLHVLVSGEANSFLMTYTDLSSEFEANKAAFESAWMSMTSIDVKGQAPRRYQQAILAGAGLSGLALLFGMLAVARRLRAKKSIEREGSEEAMFSSSGHVSSVPMTVSGVWNLAEKRFEEQHLSDVAHFS